MSNNHLLRYQKFYLNNFIDTFVLEDRQKFWRSRLINGSIESWGDLTAWDFWDDNYVNKKNCNEWTKSLDSLTELDCIKKNMDRICVVIKLGHDEVSIESCMLSEIIRHEYYLLEGIIVVDPFKLGIAKNHDGEYCLCLN